MTQNDSKHMVARRLRPRKARTLRIAVSLAGVLAGVVVLVYATGFHVETVWVERETQVKTPGLPPEELPPVFPLPAELGPPRTVTLKQLVPVERSEPYLLELAALGGLELSPAGKVLEKKTKSLCPT